MQKKLTLSLVAVAVVIAGVALTSAFEAHIINVTAHIENGLTVSTEEIAFGTVFPQEYVEESFSIGLSESFMAAERVDDVEYVIKQKPKCECKDWIGEGTPTEVCPEGQYAPVDYATHACPCGYTQMEDLCQFLSKVDADPEDKNDHSHPSYYSIGPDGIPMTEDDFCPILSADNAKGRLSKIEQDIIDVWTVDLKVPPVEGYVGQEWPESCSKYIVPNNDIDYGCDLWIEVTEISEKNGDIGCIDRASVMLVLDRSGSVGAYMTDLKDAAKAFVDALAPTTDGIHMGEVSFADTAHLDVHLTSDGDAVKGAINALTSGGMTNLEDAILKTTAELGDPTYDRDDTISPDYMVIITDGNPTASNGGDSYIAATIAANAADTAGIIIYVVGIGSVDETYLKTNIATDESYYYGVSNWDQLKTLLEGLGTCT